MSSYSYSIADVCKPDCILWGKNRPTCDNASVSPYDKYEGCVCEYFIKPLGSNRVANEWYQKYCQEKGVLDVSLPLLLCDYVP